MKKLAKKYKHKKLRLKNQKAKEMLMLLSKLKNHHIKTLLGLIQKMIIDIIILVQLKLL